MCVSDLPIDSSQLLQHSSSPVLEDLFLFSSAFRYLEMRNHIWKIAGLRYNCSADKASCCKIILIQRGNSQHIHFVLCSVLVQFWRQFQCPHPPSDSGCLRCQSSFSTIQNQFHWISQLNAPLFRCEGKVCLWLLGDQLFIEWSKRLSKHILCKVFLGDSTKRASVWSLPPHWQSFYSDKFDTKGAFLKLMTSLDNARFQLSICSSPVWFTYLEYTTLKMTLSHLTPWFCKGTAQFDTSHLSLQKARNNLKSTKAFTKLHGAYLSRRCVIDCRFTTSSTWEGETLCLMWKCTKEVHGNFARN